MFLFFVFIIVVAFVLCSLSLIWFFSSIKLKRKTPTHIKKHNNNDARLPVSNRVGEPRQWTHIDVKHKNMGSSFKWGKRISEWPANCDKHSRSLTVEAAAADDSRLIVNI